MEAMRGRTFGCVALLSVAGILGASGEPHAANAGGTGRCALSLELGRRSGTSPGQFHLDLVFVNRGEARCRLAGWPDVELIGPNDPTFGSIYDLPRQSGRRETVTLPAGESAHATLTWLPPADHVTRWVPGYVRVVVPTANGPSGPMAVAWNRGPVLRQDRATYPGTYIGPIQRGAG
jgi:Protein of unknown function (DUF4232)